MRNMKSVIAGLLVLCPLLSRPQMSASVTTSAELQAKLQELRQKADAGDGSASVKLVEYPNHYTMLAFRKRTGGAEVHTHYADVFAILQGHARLVTGGKLVNEKDAASDEPRGSAVEGGSAQALNPGD